MVSNLQELQGILQRGHKCSYILVPKHKKEICTFCTFCSLYTNNQRFCYPNCDIANLLFLRIDFWKALGHKFAQIDRVWKEVRIFFKLCENSNVFSHPEHKKK